jgi:hypothetical protein
MCVGRRVEFLETGLYHQLPFWTGTHLSSLLPNDTTGFFPPFLHPLTNGFRFLQHDCGSNLSPFTFPRCCYATHFNDV